jgi:hypothetical protein
MGPTDTGARGRRRTTRWIATVFATVAATIAIGAAPTSADWSPTGNLAEPGHQLTASAVAYDASGRGYLMYNRYVSGFVYEVYLRERAPGSAAWGPWQVLPTGSGQVANPVLDVNASGDVLLAFLRSGQVASMVRPAGGSWESPATYSSPGTSGPGSGFASGISAALGDDGTAVVAWSINNSCCGVVTKWRVGAAARIPGAGWQSSAQVWDTSVQDVHSVPAVTVESDGAGIVAFGGRSASNNLDELYTAELNTGAWAAPVLRSSVFNGSNVQVVGASAGTTAAFGFARGTIMQVIARDAGAWSPTYTVSTNNIGDQPAIAVGGDGSIHVGYRNQAGVFGGNLASGTATGGFTTQLISATGGVPRPATNTAGDLALAWDEYGQTGRFAVVAFRPAGSSTLGAPHPLTTTASTNDTGASAAVDAWGHVLAVATPIGTNGFGVALEGAIEGRDPAQHDGVGFPSVSPAVAQAGDQVTCTPDGFSGTLPIGYSYQWKRAGDAIDGATSSTYAVQPTDVGEPISCLVTATNEGGTAAAESAELMVSYTAPTNLTPPSLVGIVEAGELVTCDTGSWSGEPAPDLAIEWARGGVTIPDETADTYEITVDDAGDTLACIVTATNPGGSAVASSATQSVPTVAPPMNVTAPTLVGPNRPAIGDVLTCSPGAWTGAPTPGLYPEWLRNGLLIPLAYDTTYVVAAEDAGTVVTCQVTGENIAGSQTVAATNSRTLDPAPVNTALPSVRNAPGSTWSVGGTARCSRGTWTDAQTYAYEWYRNGTPISGATSQDYLLTSADAGQNVSCAVTATGRMGTASAMSPARALAGAPVMVSPPTISGTPRPNRTLRCSRGTWTGASSFAYAWLRNGTLTAVTGTQYAVPVGDVGAFISCRVTASGPGGSAFADSASVQIQP